MKKLLTLFLSALLAICCLLPLAACEDGIQAEHKRIIGIDSEKTYMKTKVYIKHQKDMMGKEIDFEFYSYDKVVEDELEGVDLEVEKAWDDPEIVVQKYSLREDGYNEEFGCYRYMVYLVLYMPNVSWRVQINSVTLKISGEDYKFSSNIFFDIYNYRPVYIEPLSFGFNQYSSGRTEPYGLHIGTRYDMTLKSVQFQTEGFEILSYFIEYYNISQDHTIEKVGESLPITLEAQKTYQIFVEAIPPQDCLYYGYEFEAVVEINGYELKYNDTDGTDSGVRFKGSALNVLERENPE